MKIKVITILGIIFLIEFTSLQAQNIDRVTLSAGGESTDEVSYVIGETFNFSLANGNIILETGSQGSTVNTGGLNTNINEIQENGITLSYYPNPVKDYFYISINGDIEETELVILIFDINGKLMFQNKIKYSNIMQLNISHLNTGSYIMSIANITNRVYGIQKIIKE